jgi:hypothetical protein
MSSTVIKKGADAENTCRECGKELQDFVILQADSPKPAPPLASFSSNAQKFERVNAFIENGCKKIDRKFPNVCLNCLDLITAELDKQIKQAEQEQKVYEEFRKSRIERDKERKKLDLQLQQVREKKKQQFCFFFLFFSLQFLSEIRFPLCVFQMKEEESVLLKQLCTVYERKAKIYSEQDTSTEEIEKQKQDEQEYCPNYNSPFLCATTHSFCCWPTKTPRYFKEFLALQNDFYGLVDEGEILKSKMKYVNTSIHALERRNVYQDVFFIQTDSKIGSISNFRVGKSPAVQVKKKNQISSN